MSAVPEPAKFTPISDVDRKTFDEQGYLIVPNALSADQVSDLNRVVDEVHADHQARGLAEPDGPLHTLGAVYQRPEIATLVDLETVFPHMWGHLSWNIFVYHSHIDVTTPTGDPDELIWEWHQDGYRQNVDIPDDPRPRLSMKVGYALTDLSEKGSGATLVLPGSHLSNTLARTAPGSGNEYERPPGTVELSLRAGDAFIFDRRLWHARSVNRSSLTRKMIFIAYTYRWIRSRDDVDENSLAGYWHDLSPLQRQLVGDGEDAANFHGVSSETGLWDDRIPLRSLLKQHGRLDRSQHYLR
ncbi:phytanoyl-CoA dioxygenase family protein [Nonomuraea sp. NPDC049129]|uniref:phytanoyl-CoA dioxygenase family protein n=1 Tax=Nonomuraea sp. NPDC049129 TaxID=3155272 RepID=UPI0033D97DB0